MSLSALGQDVSVGHQRKRHANIQDKIQGLWSTSKLFEKALAHFEGMCYYYYNTVHIKGR